LFGVYVATAGTSIYSAFDFITFAETLANHMEDKKDQSSVTTIDADINFKFTL